MSGRSRRREGGQGAASGLPPIYEGPEVLGALLARAGSTLKAEEAIARLTAAVAAKEPRSAVIPGLFEAEPRFGSPDEARRLYGNLFGLWARLEAGLGAHDDAPDVVPEPPAPPPLPERGAAGDASLTADLVDAVWRNLAALPPRELARRRDRFTNTQADALVWLDDAALPESGVLAAADLCFEAWAMFDQALGDRLRGVTWKELKALEREPPPLEATQPALAAYVAEALDTLEAEDDRFDEAARAQVERVVAAVAAALAAALRLPS